MLPDDVIQVNGVVANAYLAGTPDAWIVVDTGIPGFSSKIRRLAARHFPNARPAAIILTHGHFDHSGSALELAAAWDIPIYAHALELPYLTGQSDYPAPNLAAGGPMSHFARFFGRTKGLDLGARIHPLPDSHAVPGLPDWRWLHTPGHTPGHVSLFRDRDKTLIAGDALATMDLDSWSGLMLQKPGIFRPPAPFTSDWTSANRSLASLDALHPTVVAAGHGRVCNRWCYPASK